MTKGLADKRGDRMKRFNRCGRVVSLFFTAWLLALGCQSQQSPVEQKDSKAGAQGTGAGGAVACVKTAPISKGTITNHIVVYGEIIPAPGALRTVSVPYESQVLAIEVNDGQKVSKGEPLLQIQPSPDTRLQLEQARNAFDLQQQSFQQMQRRYDLKLATNEQLLQAKQTLEQAKLRLESLTRRGIGGEKQLPAGVSGLVKKVYAQEGAIVAAGNPLIDIVAQNRVEVLLGVEPETIALVRVGQEVSLKRVNVPESPVASGPVRKVSYAVNPATRLVDVFVTLPSTTGFLLGESITGKIPVTSSEGLIVPRSAVLPEGDRNVLFTIKDGNAVARNVKIGRKTSKEYQITGKNLQAGEPVVVEGNYELVDGMQVRTGACQ